MMYLLGHARWSNGWDQPVYHPWYSHPLQSWPAAPVGLPLIADYPWWGREAGQLEYRPVPKQPLELHPLLCQKRGSGLWDVTGDSSKMLRITSQNVVVPVSDHFLQAPATFPPVRRMYILYDSLPWQTEIDSPPGVKIQDVLDAIHDTLHTPLTAEDWREQHPVKQKAIQRAMLKRLAKSPPTVKAEILRIDCLLGKTKFMGLKPAGWAGEEWVLCLDAK